VGHDALITHVTLATVGQATPDVKLLDVTADLGDVVLANGYVYGLPRVDQWVEMHSVAVATNTQQKAGTLRAGSLGRALASGQYLYAANNGLSPSDFEKWDLRSGKAVRVGDSPYHGDYPICGNIWPSEDGTRLYTPCGATFRATTDPATDMTYAGTFDLTRAGTGNGSGIVISLSHSAEKKEIVLVDGPSPYASDCNISATLYDPPCVSRLRFYDSDFLQLTGDFTLPPVTVDGTRYPHRGLFVFHDGSGDGRYLISRAMNTPAGVASVYLTRVVR
jgi:hypothetical protein